MSITSNGGDIPVAAFRYYVDGAQAIDITKRLEDSVRRLDNVDLNNVSAGYDRLTSLAKGLLPAIGAAQVLGFFKSAVTAVDELGDAAERAQLSVEEFSKLQFIAQKTDVEFGELTNAIKKYQQGLSDAAVGQGAVANGLEAIGLSAATLRGLSLEEQLALIAENFNRLSSREDRARVAQDLFSKSGQAMIPVLKQGSEGIKQLSADAERMGFVVDSYASAGIDKLTKSVGGFFRALTLGAGGAIGTFFADIAGSGDDVLDLERRLTGLRQAQERLQRGIFVAYEDPATALSNINKQIDELAPRLERLRELERLTNGEGSSSGGPRRRRAAADPVQAFDIGAIRALRIEENEYASVMRNIAKERERQADGYKRLQLDSANDVAASVRAVEQDNFRQATNDFEQELKRRNELIEQYKKYQTDQEEELQEDLLNIRQQGLLAAQTLLTAYGGKFASVAKAILIVEKAMAIRSIIMSTHEAMMKVIAKWGVPWGYAAAGAVAVYGAARVAAVASTVAGGDSGPSIGSPGAPISTQPGSTDNNVDANPDANGQRVVQLVINGDVYSGRETASWLIERLQNAINENDVLIFNSNSRQARELLGK